jgi:energy-coupling factor transporter ATP-binding protein EcfA2
MHDDNDNNYLILSATDLRDIAEFMDKVVRLDTGELYMDGELAVCSNEELLGHIVHDEGVLMFRPCGGGYFGKVSLYYQENDIEWRLPVKKEIKLVKTADESP